MRKIINAVNWPIVMERVAAIVYVLLFGAAILALMLERQLMGAFQ